MGKGVKLDVLGEGEGLHILDVSSSYQKAVCGWLDPKRKRHVQWAKALTGEGLVAASDDNGAHTLISIELLQGLVELGDEISTEGWPWENTREKERDSDPGIHSTTQTLRSPTRQSVSQFVIHPSSQPASQQASQQARERVREIHPAISQRDPKGKNTIECLGTVELDESNLSLLLNKEISRSSLDTCT